MTEIYSPGSHLLLTLHVDDDHLLIGLSDFQDFLQQKIAEFDLQVVGISTHVFDGGGFTAAICLMESHICIHTWPEFNQLTLDIYLCNYLKDNTEKVTLLGEEFKAYFKSKVLKETVVNR